MSSVKYNRGEKILLECKVSSNDVTDIKWSSSDLSIKDIALTSTEDVFNAGLHKFQISFDSTTLTAGLSYTFQVSAYYPGNYLNQDDSAKDITYAISSILVMINDVPYGGTLSISPSNGIALTTQY